MRDLIITLFIVIPLVTNIVSLVAGVLLYFWQAWQRRRRKAQRGRSAEGTQ